MTNNLSDAKKLEIVLNHLQINGNKLSKILNYKSPASVYHVLEGMNNLSSKMIEGIVSKFPQISYQFLKNGKGEALLKDPGEKEKQRSLILALTGEHQMSIPVNYDLPKKEYSQADQLELLVENSKKTNLLLNALLEEIQHLNKKFK